MCVDCQHGVPVKITHGINASTSTEHPATPPPDDIPVDSTPSGFDIVPGDNAKGATKIAKRVWALDQSVALWGSESAIRG